MASKNAPSDYRGNVNAEVIYEIEGDSQIASESLSEANVRGTRFPNISCNPDGKGLRHRPIGFDVRRVAQRLGRHSRSLIDRGRERLRMPTHALLVCYHPVDELSERSRGLLRHFASVRLDRAIEGRKVRHFIAMVEGSIEPRRVPSFRIYCIACCVRSVNGIVTRPCHV